MVQLSLAYSRLHQQARSRIHSTLPSHAGLHPFPCGSWHGLQPAPVKLSKVEQHRANRSVVAHKKVLALGFGLSIRVRLCKESHSRKASLQWRDSLPGTMEDMASRAPVRIICKIADVTLTVLPDTGCAG